MKNFDKISNQIHCLIILYNKIAKKIHLVTKFQIMEIKLIPTQTVMIGHALIAVPTSHLLILLSKTMRSGALSIK